MRIVFMGTPEFAVASLKALLAAGEQVIAVVTAPDRPAGRGRILQQSAVKQFAIAQGLPVLQPVRLRDPEFLAELAQLKADLQVVVAFRMLPELVWDMPARGTINLHASLLPDYRGAAPINHVLINGEEKTGVTTFILSHEIDTGHVLFSREVPIKEEDNAGDLHDRLMGVGAELLVDTVSAIGQGDYVPVPQSALIGNRSLHPAPKIFKEDCRIDWNQPTEKVHNLIRGLSPYPAAFTDLDGQVLKIFQGDKRIESHQFKPGDFASDGKSYLRYFTKDGFIELNDIQIAGKKRMSIAEFLRGYRLPAKR